MHVRMIVTYFKGKMTPKEGHVDCPKDQGAFVLSECFKVLCSKHAELDKMLPKQLKNREFDIVVHGEYLQGFDYKETDINTIPQRGMAWVHDKPLFNVLQLGIPEEERPLIKV